MIARHHSTQKSRYLRRRASWVSFAGILCISALQLFLSGCDDPVNGILSDAIRKLEEQSTNWQTVLTQTKEDLIKAGQTTISSEVDRALGSAIGDAGATGMCGVDYLRMRAKEDLLRILAKYNNTTIVRQPHFCSPNPPHIDMSLAPDRRSSIEMYGFNFDVAKDSLKLFIIDNNGATREVTKNSYGVSNIAFPTDYHLTVNLSNNGVQLNASSKQLLFTLPGDKTHPINILQPEAPLGVSVNLCNPHNNWLGYKDNPAIETYYAGTTRQGLPNVAIRIKLLNAPSSMGIDYMCHFQGCGWECVASRDNFNSIAANGGTAGSDSPQRWRQLEAIKIRLTGAPAGIRVKYKSYIQDMGWENGWSSDNNPSGTVGSGKRLEAICVKIVKE